MHQGVMEAGTTTQQALATRPPRHAGTCSSYTEVLAKFCNTYLCPGPQRVIFWSDPEWDIHTSWIPKTGFSILSGHRHLASPPDYSILRRWQEDT